MGIPYLEKLRESIIVMTAPPQGNGGLTERVEEVLSAVLPFTKYFIFMGMLESVILQELIILYFSAI